ncbi:MULTISPECIES: gamma carbonic anhydrase family protein [Pseudomonas]|uniref:gamma carbonic anhydrase family protein n=1 Tax=Pseudomonas TaxID=286 RepID=UPI0008769C01|nr:MULTISPECIES: gamma carbonic anhydrase family protein [Pseudomonas]MDB6444060.1 gamma carbonic anhydrase family protein [Pseudomonas sp. 21TX0197]NHN66331.1 gamma carbonic anhydrase family protein [Pseudomonas fluorescens]SCX68531.1 Carbonic anhydrase or acetyltransferase, isoleucine patch superfamily [Pseudomonas sp. NFACC32-1]SFX75769.1 Carbonic anhydrase or acetyltransferase, isoleucine patch superfamily [Pseudomonas sp. NFACC47-1]SFY27038.1 Carbonic anhydrase or acetyltransferase, isole
MPGKAKLNQKIAPTARIASSAVLEGNVSIGAGTVIGHGAVLVAEGGALTIGENCIVMENAVIRSTAHDDCHIGNHVMVGPHCHLTGCRIDDEVFVATGASVFNGARLGKGAEVRINGVVHIKTVLEPGATVPIGWIAVGDPAQLFSPDQHDELWAVQKELDFPRYVFGVDRESEGVVRQMMERYARFLRQQQVGDE